MAIRSLATSEEQICYSVDSADQTVDFFLKYREKKKSLEKDAEILEDKAFLSRWRIKHCRLMKKLEEGSR